jgi:hypothetical protein
MPHRQLSVLKLQLLSALAAALAAALSACGGANTDTTPNPSIEVVSGTPTLLGTTRFDLVDVGYEQSEYFISGAARSYVNTTPLTADGRWSVEFRDMARYRTRILVYRPIDPAAFNGTVVIEWLNVSGGTEASSAWIMAHTEMLRRGYAWVGVSAQKAGIDGGGINLTGLALNLKAVNSARYGSLAHPGDKYAFDIYSQATQAVLHPSGIDPLGGLHVGRALAAGESQSADFLLTYVDAIAPSAQLFNGYLIHSRFHGTVALDPPATYSPDFLTRSTVNVRLDLGVPVLNLETESDIFQLGAYPDLQDDSPNFRLWEIAGSAHADLYVSSTGLTDLGTDPSIAGIVATTTPNPLFSCPKPINDGPQHFVVNAAVAALDTWVRTGTAPAHANRLEVNAPSQAFVTDSIGNTIGGIRTPAVDAPIAILSGEGQTGSILCGLFGTTQLLDQVQLANLYPSHSAFVAAVTASADDAVGAGFLLQPDADLIKAWAQQSTVDNP